MELITKKRQMLYKSESGGRIMVRISLPTSEEKSELSELYNALGEKYLLSAKEFILREAEAVSYFFDVSYEEENTHKYLKIKRLSTLKLGGKTLKSTVLNDWFNKDDLRLKK